MDRPASVVLDGFDRLATPDVLYDLYHVEGLSLYLIANNEDAVLARLEPRLRSRLGNATSVQFDRYGLDGLEASERDFRVVLVPDAAAGADETAQRELCRVGVHLLPVDDCLAWLGGGTPAPRITPAETV